VADEERGQKAGEVAPGSRVFGTVKDVRPPAREVALPAREPLFLVVAHMACTGRGRVKTALRCHITWRGAKWWTPIDRIDDQLAFWVAPLSQVELRNVVVKLWLVRHGIDFSSEFDPRRKRSSG
jgi:hypothetical protein